MNRMNCILLDGSLCFDSRRFFASFVGIGLPLRLISELEPSAIIHRNTYFIAYYNEAGRLTRCDKMVYGNRILSHVYEYHASGFLKSASIRSGDDDDGGVIFFDENGKRLAPEWRRNENIATCNEQDVAR